MNYPRLSNAIRGFLLSREALDRSKNTINDYTNNLERFLEYMGDKTITEISSDDIEGYFVWLRKDYRWGLPHEEHKTKKLSSKSILNVWVGLSSFWHWTSEEFKITTPFKMKKPKVYDKPIAPFTKEEVQTLLKSCESVEYTMPQLDKPVTCRRNTRFRDKAIILFLYDSGARASELCSLRMFELEMDHRRAFVHGKGRKRRYIYFGKICAQAIWKYHAFRFSDGDPEDDDYVFAARNNIHPMTPSNLRNLLKRRGDSAGVENVHPHRFRHSFAVAYLVNGGDPYSLPNLLGHETMEMTRKYSYIAGRNMDEIYRRASPGDNLHK